MVRPAIALVGALAAVAACKGPPARIVAGSGDTVVVNNVRPVSLPARVSDAAGRPLDSTRVRYEWASGVPVPVSRAGVVTCTRSGNAVVRASLGPVVTRVTLICQPVREVRSTMDGDFVLGDSARELSLVAVGVDGRPVTLLAARVRVIDSTVATLEHARDRVRVRPLRPGWTPIDVEVGDQRALAGATVYAPVRTFDGLRPDQQLVAAPVRVRAGGAVRWPLPTGLFFLTFLPDPSARSLPTLTVDGPVRCMPALGPGVYWSNCLARVPGATVSIAHPGSEAPDIAGALAIKRQDDR